MREGGGQGACALYPQSHVNCPQPSCISLRPVVVGVVDVFDVVDADVDFDVVVVVLVVVVVVVVVVFVVAAVVRRRHRCRMWWAPN